MATIDEPNCPKVTECRDCGTKQFVACVNTKDAARFVRHAEAVFRAAPVRELTLSEEPTQA